MTKPAETRRGGALPFRWGALRIGCAAGLICRAAAAPALELTPPNGRLRVGVEVKHFEGVAAAPTTVPAAEPAQASQFVLGADVPALTGPGRGGRGGACVYPEHGKTNEEWADLINTARKAPRGLSVMPWAPERDTGSEDGSAGPAVWVLDQPTTLSNRPASGARAAVNP